MQSVLDLIHDHLAQNETGEALKKLHSIFSFAESELANDAILLSAQWKKFNSDIRRGLLDYNQENLTRNQLADRILSLANEIKEDPSRFGELDRMEKELNRAIESKDSHQLSSSVKAALFERISLAKERGIHFPVLWVCDSVNKLEYEILTIQSMGLQVDTAYTSKQAHDMIRSKTYELILSDIKREGIAEEGLRFHQQLVKEQIDLPMIFYVGHVNRSKGVPPYAFGIAALPNELFHLVLDVLARR